MIKNNIVYFVLSCIGFVFIALGGVLLILGVYLDSVLSIYIGLGLILGSIVFYIIIAILFLMNYFKKRR